MSCAVLAVAAWTAAGDLPALVALLHADGSALGTPPYRADDLASPRTGTIAGLDRDAPATALLERVCRDVLGDSVPERTGLVVGTSSGALAGPWERWHAAHLAGEPLPEPDGRDGPARDVARRLGLGGPVATLSVACVSGTAALAVGEGWLRDGLCDRVICAGVDALSRFVHAGFAGLGALSAGDPRPFTADHDGMLLGEGAAALLLARDGERPLAWLRGVGLSTDAAHATTPDPAAGGAIRALVAALERAEILAEAVDGVSVHGTGTPSSDAMESTALGHVFPAGIPSIHVVKPAIGHTLGAAGAIEAAVVVDALVRGRLPPDPTGPAAGVPHVVASMSSAFGGMNAAIVFSDGPGPSPAPGGVATGRTADVVDHPDAWPDAPSAFHRAPPYVRAGLLAVRAMLADLPAGTIALVLSSARGCRAVDLAYHERLLREGPARASRRDFVATLPAAPLTEAAMLWRIHGPILAFVGPTDPVAEAGRLVRHGHATAALALRVDHEPGAPATATATLLVGVPA